MNRIDKIRQKIAEGRLVKGFFVSMADSMVSEIAGYAGYDYVWIDAEHGPLDRQEIFHHIVASQGAGCCAFVRMPNADPSMMKAILDMGPDGVIFPFVNNREIAQMAVDSCAYPDSDLHGMRGQGPIRAIKYGLEDESTYLKSAYEKVFKIMQIETLEGYENLDEIMQVKGIDSLFIGAADMSRSIAGKDNGYDLDTVYNDICRRVRANNIILGVAIGASAQEAARVTAKGAQWAVFGQDSRILACGLKANLDALKDF